MLNRRHLLLHRTPPHHSMTLSIVTRSHREELPTYSFLPCSHEERVVKVHILIKLIWVRLHFNVFITRAATTIVVAAVVVLSLIIVKEMRVVL